jgi:hypothetical protein
MVTECSQLVTVPDLLLLRAFARGQGVVACRLLFKPTHVKYLDQVVSIIELFEEWICLVEGII